MTPTKVMLPGMNVMVPDEKPPFRLLITGSRIWRDPERIWWALNNIDSKLFTRPAILIHGGADGADKMAATHWWSLAHGALNIGPRSLEPHLPNWSTYGKRAGYERNDRMVALGANLCLAFIRENSKGATQCANAAEKAGIKVIRMRDNG